MKSHWRLVLLSLGVVVLLSYSTMFAAVSAPNERSRVYLAVALVDHNTLSIDEPVRRFGAILDTARFEGHLYSDKAPGSSFLGATLYGVVRLFTLSSDWTIEQLIVLMRTALMVPLGLVGFWVIRRLLGSLRIGPGLVDLVSTGWILGTAAFHYSTAFYGHQIGATCLLVGLHFIERAEQRVASAPETSPVALCLAAGMCAGFAGVTEYQAGILSVLLALYVLAGPLRQHTPAWLGFATGALPFVLLLGMYHWRAFGGPFELSYHHLSHTQWQQLHTQGVGGITWPQAEAFLGCTLSLHRGVFITSPMFLFAIAGAAALWRVRRRLAVLLSVAALYALLLVSSSNMWVAGWSYGPRLLVFVMGWTSLLVAAGAQWATRWRVGEVLLRASIVFGIASNQLVQAVFPEPPTEAQNPWVDVVGELLARDMVAPNLVSGHVGVPGVASLMPAIVIVAAIVVMVLIRPVFARRARERAIIAGVSALMVVGASLWVVGLGPTMDEQQRRAFQRFVAQLERADGR
jgi:hypothetical protein